MSDKPTEPQLVTTRAEEMRWLADHEQWLEENHAGEWIAVNGYELISFGDNLSGVLEQARGKGVLDPLVTAVKNRDVQGMILIRQCR